jgi:transcriptional regulator with GAF, ATPase, and Fis domain
MSETVCDPADTMHQLDALTGRFASAAVGHGADAINQEIAATLQQIGEVLGVDRVALLSATDRIELYSWVRPGSEIARGAAPADPVSTGRRIFNLAVGTRRDRQEWPPAVVSQLQLLADLMGLAIRCGQQLRERAGRRSEDLQPTSGPDGIGPIAVEDAEFEDIIGDSPALRVAIARVQEVAATDASVVILGETGTGKELFARAVHSRSGRRGRPFVRVNCAALPATLIESELFGHERGAFTGAVSMRQGRFELAHRGTIFLDEIGDLGAEVQAKLLRVLQEGEFERVGSSQSRKVDVRVVAATHHDLETAVKEGHFRADLYYRLNVFPIVLPPLRDRPEDIPRLAWFFINRRQRALNRRFTKLPGDVLAALQRHSWPGNVRELENVIERAMIHSTGDTLLLDDGPGLQVSNVTCDTDTLQELERRHIENALRRAGWRINGTGNAAEALGLHPNTLRFRMKKLGIRRPTASGVVDFKRLLA